MMDKLMTVREVAGLLRVGVVTVQRWCKSGEMPSMKVGKRYLISEVEFEEWLKKKKGVADGANNF